jgi:hypothetical protein
MRKIIHVIIISILLICPARAIEISHDGQDVRVPPGGSVVKQISFLNREEAPRWVRVNLSDTGPLTSISTENAENEVRATARGWTYVQQNWVEVGPQKILKYPVEFLPPYKTVPGRYTVWLLLEQIRERPKVQGEEQRGTVLQTQAVETYFLPVAVNVIGRK